MKKAFLILFIVVLAGCTSPPTKEELSIADYGSPVSQEEGQAIVMSFFGAYLKDPDSALYKFSKINKGYYKEGVLDGGKLYTGYACVVWVNAKNSFGGYTGYKTYNVVIKNGRVIKAVKKDR